jgi:hypothetical protein
MSSQNEQAYDDKLLARYLLADLSPDETERLDELSIADDECASRLTAIENDLVDAYVRDELSPEDTESFRSSYLSSAKRRQKVAFAETLLALEKQGAARVAQPENSTGQKIASSASPGPSRFPPLARWMPAWGFAVAALAMLVVAAYLLRANLALRQQVNQANEHQKAIDQLTGQLEEQVRRLENSDAESLKGQKPPQVGPSELKTVALLLPPPTRSAGKLSAISVPAGTNVAILVLALESDDFPHYRAALKDSAGNRVLWSSPALEASPLGQTRAVSVSFPAGLLKQQTYIAELTGIPAHGKPEVVGSYPFRTMLK